MALIRDPIMIVSAPRTGSTLLFETLSFSPSLWTIGGESHTVIEGIRALHPASRDWHSNVLGADDADPRTARQVRRRFATQLRDRTGRRPAPYESPLRLLEKTPRNALRVPFLATVFPRARFVYLHRDAAETIASILAGWRSSQYVTYRSLPEWAGPAWSFLLVPGWRELSGRPLVHVAACQWAITTRVLLTDLAVLPPWRRVVSSYDRLVADPPAEIARLCAQLGVAWDTPLGPRLLPSASTRTPPRPLKWHDQRDEIEEVLPLVAAERALADAALADPPAAVPT